jgi:hypothetical protein
MDNTAYYVAGIDVHKRMLAVVVAKARDDRHGCKNAPSRKS